MRKIAIVFFTAFLLAGLICCKSQKANKGCATANAAQPVMVISEEKG
jgi:hypothetical protein